MKCIMLQLGDHAIERACVECPSYILSAILYFCLLQRISRTVAKDVGRSVGHVRKRVETAVMHSDPQALSNLLPRPSSRVRQIQDQTLGPFRKGPRVCERVQESDLVFVEPKGSKRV
jgi:hypothetical protein